MKHITAIHRLEETTLRLGGNGDNWHTTWADDDRQYTGLCDGRGWPDMPQAYIINGNPQPAAQGRKRKMPYFNSRAYIINGNPPNVAFQYLPGYPDLVGPSDDPEYCEYYCFGILALNHHIYQFFSTLSETPSYRFTGAKLIFSPDNGNTWRNQDGSFPVSWERKEKRTKDNMVFFEEPDDAFSLLTVLQMGKGYRDNTDGFVYIYAPNGSVDGRMNELVMCRMPKGRILERRAYEFFAGRDPKGGAKWSGSIADRAPVHTFPTGWVNRNAHPYAWHPSVIYYAPLGLYLMANWGMGCTPDGGEWFGKPNYLGFWTAPQPWGPWTQVHEETEWIPVGDGNARCYQPQIIPKWIADDGKSFWLVWTDYQKAEDGKRPYYAFNTQKAQVLFD